MLIYRISEISAYKKTIKQFLQPMIEQVLGGGWMCKEDMLLFLGQFFRANYIFVSVFFNSPMPFWVDFTTICIFFAVYYVYFINKSNSVLGTKFS